MKPVSEGTSQGITAKSKIQSPGDFVSAATSLREEFPTQDIIVEKFLGGREFTVTMLGSDKDARMLGIIEGRYGAMKEESLDFMTCKAKTFDDDEECVSDTLVTHLLDSDVQVQEAAELATRTWRALRCRDIGRVDVRFDTENENCYVLEVMRKDFL